MRIAVLFDNFGPYHIARFAALGESFELLAMELNKSSSEYAWNSALYVPFERITLFDGDFERTAVSRKIGQALEAFQPEVVFVPGWSSQAALQTLLWANRANVPAVVMSASQVIDYQRTPLKEFVKRAIMSGFSGAIVGGRAQAAYVTQLGMDADLVRLGKPPASGAA